jgi:hypothetical protein
MRNISPRRSAIIAIVLATSLALGDSALAQQPETPADSVQRDSVAQDSTPPDPRPPSHHSLWMYLLIPVGVAAMVVMGAAPASYAFLEAPAERPPLAILEEHRAAYVSLGGLFYEGETMAHSANFEMIRKGVLVELKVEDFYRPYHFQYLTARAGYLFHPNVGAAGGVTVGYRHAHRDPTQAGLEIGLPLYIGVRQPTGTMRLEPTYVVSGHGVLWSYRVQADFPLPGTPYIAGFSGVGKSYPLTGGHPRHDHPRKSLYVGAFTLLFGARF